MAQAGVGLRPGSMLVECARTCAETHDAALETLAFCLDEGGALADPDVVRLLLDCADLCRTSADLMFRGSGAHPEIGRACASVCELTAGELTVHAVEPVRSFVEKARRCATSCRQMSR